MQNPKDTKILVTGVAGFIGYHLTSLLLKEGFTLFGYDGLTEYYDVSLKKARLKLLSSFPTFKFEEGMLEDVQRLSNCLNEFMPDIVIHLAAQAGVRYSLENPSAYIQSNIVGTHNLLEAIKGKNVAHLLMASTSSVYGANIEMPFAENQKADTQLTLYSATKKANESMSHAYSHLWRTPTTVFRFFTVYGPWGRPDMALFKFVDAILNDREIDIFNNGEMFRDFTFVDDLVLSIRRLMNVIPEQENTQSAVNGDTLSPVAPWRVVNIGNSEKVELLEFIRVIEDSLGILARKKFLPLQPGDVKATWSDSSLLFELTGYRPSTRFEDGIRSFIAWYREYYKND